MWSNVTFNYIVILYKKRFSYLAVKEGTIRLVNGNTNLQGRLEIYHNNTWGTICDDSFDILDANVACRQLGFSSAINYANSFYNGQASGKIWLDDLHCSGFESSLIDCYHRGWGAHNCKHSEDIGISCYNGIINPFYCYLSYH